MAEPTHNDQLQKSVDEKVLWAFHWQGAISEETGMSIKAMAEAYGWTYHHALRTRIARLVEEGKLLSNKGQKVDANKICYWLPEEAE